MIGRMANFAGVVTTGIYCRPACGAQPRSTNVYGFTLAASAEAAGLRACLQCRPYRTQPPLNWDGPDVVCRGVRLILNGGLDNAAEEDLAARLAISARHLRRLFVEHLGVTPDELARSTRAHFARRLIDDTDFTMAEIAFMAGFGSIRQFNRACSEIFRASPRELRAKRRVKDRLVADGGLILRLPFQGPLDWDRMLGYLAARAIPGVENVSNRTYRRTVMIDGDPGMFELLPGGPDHLLLRAHIPHWEGLIHIAHRARQIFNLDAEVRVAVEHLRSDPLMKRLGGALPGVRPPGTWDAFETGVQAIAGQRLEPQVAASLTARLSDAYGTPMGGLEIFGLTRTFPSAATLESSDLDRLGIPKGKADTIRSFAGAVVGGTVRLDGSQPYDALTQVLRELPGMGPQTAEYLAFRLGERDALPMSSTALRNTLSRVTRRQLTQDKLSQLADSWRPWRAHAAALLQFATTRKGASSAA